MKIGSTLRMAFIIAALASGPTLRAAPMSEADYRAARNRIEAEFKDSKAACDKLSGNAKDVCREDASGREKVARAELEYNRSGSPKDASRLALARADAVYAVARERCDNRTGNEKDVCVKVAKSKRADAVADAKLKLKVAEARKDAADAKRDAAYDVAKQKCDALAGDGKSQCLASAKSRYGKS